MSNKRIGDEALIACRRVACVIPRFGGIELFDRYFSWDSRTIRPLANLFKRPSKPLFLSPGAASSRKATQRRTRQQGVLPVLPSFFLVFKNQPSLAFFGLDQLQEV